MPNKAEIIRLWAQRGVELLYNHTAELNTLNVFPVADADTGTNLFLTFQAAQRAELSRSGNADDPFDALSSLAKGAVSAARGRLVGGTVWPIRRRVAPFEVAPFDPREAGRSQNLSPTPRLWNPSGVQMA